MHSSFRRLCIRWFWGNRCPSSIAGRLAFPSPVHSYKPLISPSSPHIPSLAHPSNSRLFPSEPSTHFPQQVIIWSQFDKDGWGHVSKHNCGKRSLLSRRCLTVTNAFSSQNLYQSLRASHVLVRRFLPQEDLSSEVVFVRSFHELGLWDIDRSFSTYFNHFRRLFGPVGFIHFIENRVAAPLRWLPIEIR